MRMLLAGVLAGFALAKAVRWAEVRYALANLDARYEAMCFNDKDK